MHVMRSLTVFVAACWGLGIGIGLEATRTAGSEPGTWPTYRVEKVAEGTAPLDERFTPGQLGLLEKLNRADRRNLPRQPELVVPETWVDDELAYSVLPAHFPASASLSRLLVVHLPGQMFGAYEAGTLVRWGPVSTGGRGSPTPAGTFHLNWRSTGRSSTVDPDWFMRWYFNFGNHDGLAFHEYALPGRPASHGCIRLLERDAQWLFEWGQGWTLDASGTRIVQPGTPVFLIGRYDFDAPPPWRSLAWLAGRLELPPWPAGEDGGTGDR